MTDDLIFLKAAGWLVLGYWLLRGWQRRNARKQAADAWSQSDHR